MKATAVVGQRVTLRCNSRVATPVNWWYRDLWGGDLFEIVVNGALANGYSLRMSVVGYDLIIHNALLNDTGEYTCAGESGFGEHHKISLTVSGSFAFTVVRTLFFFYLSEIYSISANSIFMILPRPSFAILSL